MSDEPGAIEMYVPENITFNFTDATYLVIHKTAGFTTAQDCAAYFGNLAQNTGGVSSHYIVGLDGTIVQCVPESRGAGANCCVEPGHDAFIPDSWDGQQDNGNLHTISIEHIDPSLDNSTAMPPAQIQASFQLVKHVCQRHNIPMRAATDSTGGIIGHNQIDPKSRARCPGPTYPFSELWSYLNEENQNMSGIPAHWTDVNGELRDSNNEPAEGLTGAVRTNILSGWDAANTFIKSERVASILLEDGRWGPGTLVIFRDSIIAVADHPDPALTGGQQDTNVTFRIPNGVELSWARDLITSLQAELASVQPTALQQEVINLQKKIDQARLALQ